ncbi:hypothetical protein PV325_003136 [Microctonus aethiopoides]|nr:hypothetical protein PV325_003136 [Microctonus aethiopoides]
MMEESGSKLLQIAAAIAGNMCVMAGGAMLGWSSPIISKLKEDPINDDNPLGRTIDDTEASWIGSLTPVGALIGSFMAGYLAERWGRRITLLLSVIPFSLCWLLIAVANTVEIIYVARLIGGVALAIPFTVLPMYAGEIAEISIRGILGSFLQLFITIGLLWSYCIGPYVSYTVLWIACAALPIVFFIIFYPMPESPYFLFANGRKTEAINALAKLRGKSIQGVEIEASEMEASVVEAYSHKSSVMDLFHVKSNFKALLITSALVTFQQMTGINVVLLYSETIFKSAGDAGIDASVETIIIGVVMLISSFITSLVVDRFGRRILLLISSTATTLSLGALGLFFYLKNGLEEDVTNIGWLPIASLIVFIASYCIGWGPLPWAIMGEMFASDIKSKASGITVFVCWGLAFIITKYFSNVAIAYGDYTAYWIFSVFCIVSLLFTLFLLPETKGKTLREIQYELGGTPGKN